MAILGLGTDIVELARFENMSEAGLQRLAKRVLTPTELTVFEQHARPARYLAKRFAVKEAASKALGTGIGNGISFQHFESSNNSLGAPQLVFCGEAKQRLPLHANVWVSISDEKHYAVATVIIDG
ncbi:holo-ACP synthase [Shewanella avicenniae]|uniref:Holo-[acyl-carrier-protein] synthase n=1 Tax=Shewanella avicenniae TaxID=2814294 RepID=A0ABX7QVP3_9GAMM|nr:holo-ACP synthase [Shewanella avicenniae]QSX34716.1 holo-ACP synthase [Shewanella avicenniae]